MGGSKGQGFRRTGKQGELAEGAFHVVLWLLWLRGGRDADNSRPRRAAGQALSSAGNGTFLAPPRLSPMHLL